MNVLLFYSKRTFFSICPVISGLKADTGDYMMNQEQALSIFVRTNAIRENGHFVYTQKPKEATPDNPDGWFHGSVYVNKDAVFRYPKLQRRLARAMAKSIVDDNIEVVVGPELGAVTLASRVAEELTNLTCLSEESGIEAAFIEKDGKGGWVLKREFDDAVRGRRVALCEDIINSGGSIKAVREAIERAGGIVVVIVAMWNRGGVTAEKLGFTEPNGLRCLVNKEFELYPEPSCPLCKEQGIDSVNVKLGKGKEFLVRKAALLTAS